ncbi:hypothetical protein RTP6_004667 [Batrachochytrium dendrobatidis]
MVYSYLGHIYTFYTLFITIVQSLPTVSPVQSHQTDSPQSCSQPIDTLFLIDASNGMESYLVTLNKRVPTLFKHMSSLGYTDTLYSVVAFGGASAVIQPFTDNTTQVMNTLSILAEKTGTSYGWEDQEAGLEAIRSVINMDANGVVPNSILAQKCQLYSGVSNQACYISWREKSIRNIIMVTDEDSDMPIHPFNRMADQTTAFANQSILTQNESEYFTQLYEPPFSPSILYQTTSGYLRYRSANQPLVLSDAWQQEIDQTAHKMISAGISMSLFSKSDFNGNSKGPISSWTDANAYRLALTHQYANNSDRDMSFTTLLQYGHAGLNLHVINSTNPQHIVYTGFNATGTLDGLVDNGYGQSLQAQALSELYKVEKMAHDSLSGPIAPMRVFTLQTVNDADPNANGLIDAGLLGGMVDFPRCTLPPLPLPTTTSSTVATTIKWATSTISFDNSTTMLSTASTTFELSTSTISLDNPTATASAIATATVLVGSAHSSPPISNTAAIAGGMLSAVGITAAGVILFRRSSSSLRAASVLSPEPPPSNTLNPIFEKTDPIENAIFVPKFAQGGAEGTSSATSL